MTDMEKKKIAIIVPAAESWDLYRSYLTGYPQIQYFYYPSLEEFTTDAGNVGGYDGFVIDLGTIVKSKDEEKEFFNYLLDIFPSIRISHSPDKKNVIGHSQGRLLKNDELFDHFIYDQLAGEGQEIYKNIAVIVNNDDNLNFYLSYLKKYLGFRFRVYASAEDLLNESQQRNRYCGVIVDIRTMLKAAPGEKEILNELIDSFPAVRISRSPNKKGVTGNIRDKNLQDHALFDYFLNDLCLHFHPRGVRTKKRKRLFLNVSLDFFNPNDSQLPVKANTVDVSEEGSFILGTMEVQKGEKIQLVINELDDQTPIQCTIKWIMPWGQSHNHLPGFGTRFDSMTHQQRDQLQVLLRHHN
jgi:hypothetical protein